MIKFISYVGALFFLTSCSMTPKNYAHMSHADYQARPQLHQSLLSGNGPMSEEAIGKILTSKVALPKKIHLAIVRLADANGGIDFVTIDEEIASQFYDFKNWGGRVESVTAVPHIMLGKPVTLAGLREAAVLLQADALIIIKPMTYAHWKYELLEANIAKGITSLEVLLLDTRTSVVPYTSVVTETVEVSKKGKDYSEYELTLRARKESEKKALLKVPGAISTFLSTSGI